MTTLEVIGLSKAYGAVVVADKVDLKIDRGECIGVIGPNGAGKSSVFGLIAGTIPAQEGRILLDGRDVGHLPAFRRARLGIARAFQIPQPFAELTVYENVLAAATAGAGLRGARASVAAAEALDRTGLAAKANLLAGGVPLLDRKRLELAKAVATNASVLMLDEIGGGLTDREVADLAELVAALKRDHAIIWVEHIAHALAAVADRIMVLHFGRKVLEAPPREAMASAVVREVYMGLKPDAAA